MPSEWLNVFVTLEDLSFPQQGSKLAKPGPCQHYTSLTQSSTLYCTHKDRRPLNGSVACLCLAALSLLLTTSPDHCSCKEGSFLVPVHRRVQLETNTVASNIAVDILVSLHSAALKFA